MLLNSSAGEVRRRAHARARVVQFTRPRFGQRDELPRPTRPGATPCTTRMLGFAWPSSTIGAKSPEPGSKPQMLVEAHGRPPKRSRCCRSPAYMAAGGDLAAASSLPMLPPARHEGGFSTTTGWPMLSASFCPMRRARDVGRPARQIQGAIKRIAPNGCSAPERPRRFPRSGNSVAQPWRWTGSGVLGEPRYCEAARRTVQAFKPLIEQKASAHGTLCIALEDRALHNCVTSLDPSPPRTLRVEQVPSACRWM